MEIDADKISQASDKLADRMTKSGYERYKELQGIDDRIYNLDILLEEMKRTFQEQSNLGPIKDPLGNTFMSFTFGGNGIHCVSIEIRDYEYLLDMIQKRINDLKHKFE